MYSGDIMNITYEDKVYEFEKKDGERIIFKLCVEDKYKDTPLEQLLINLNYARDDLEYEEEEYSEYNERVEEFAYCGYNEEDPDFHGMVLHLNTLGDKVDKTMNEINELVEVIEKRTKDMDNDEFIDLMIEYGVDW